MLSEDFWNMYFGEFRICQENHWDVSLDEQDSHAGRRTWERKKE